MTTATNASMVTAQTRDLGTTPSCGRDSLKVSRTSAQMSDGTAAAEWVPSENFDMEQTGPIERGDGRKLVTRFYRRPPMGRNLLRIRRVGPMPGGVLRRKHRCDGRRRERHVARIGAFHRRSTNDLSSAKLKLHQDEGCALTNLPRPARWYPQGDAATSATKGRAQPSSDQTDGGIFYVERAER
jgi:hypothetical protein